MIFYSMINVQTDPDVVVVVHFLVSKVRGVVPASPLGKAGAELVRLTLSTSALEVLPRLPAAAAAQPSAQ